MSSIKIVAVIAFSSLLSACIISPEGNTHNQSDSGFSHPDSGKNIDSRFSRPPSSKNLRDSGFSRSPTQHSKTDSGKLQPGETAAHSNNDLQFSR